MGKTRSSSLRCAPGTGPVHSSRFSYNTQKIEVVYAPAAPSPF
ncbi:hypothetical protein Ctu_3p00160 (plasmid) [Cronobacter turicensis z3032]|uniref:Uncharacterized protein n=1 Tax=Cronobacter turicensis (strain DSM 18703 / CCUG 55852 / LMG 23827 / z3032) TaxID=693216 RepID=C9Y5S6_CROTZ|nr:hypothetical protein Ctu_3p00160 [Cronobacter turicensis z3032]